MSTVFPIFFCFIRRKVFRAVYWQNLSVADATALPQRHALSVTFGDSSPKGGATGVPVRPTRDEQSLIFSETVVPCYRDSQQLDKRYCPEAAALCSRALFFALYQASLVQTKADRHANGSPSGRAGAERLRGQGRCQTALALRSYRSDEEPAYRCAAALRFSFILCRTTSRQARCTSAVRIQLTG